MSDTSPLFVSASELLAHAIELYTEGKERKFKFVILHLANAIELILKDRVIDTGSSIYKGQSTVTIGIWDAFSALDKAGVHVPERPIIELLVDDRNTIQHRFGFPNADAVFYYLREVLKFFSRFLKSEYDVELVELLRLHVSDEALATVGLIQRRDETTPLDKLFEIAPESAVMQAFGMVERKIFEHITPDPERRRALLRHGGMRLLNGVILDLAQERLIPKKLVGRFDVLRNMRNRAAHMAHFGDDTSKEQWADALAIAKDVLGAIDLAAQKGFFEKRRHDYQIAAEEGSLLRLFEIPKSSPTESGSPDSEDPDKAPEGDEQNQR